MTNGKAPLLIGLRAARANIVPALLIQALMILIVAGYYWHAPTRGLLSVLAEMKREYGYAFSAMVAVFAGAIVPETLAVVIFQRGKIRRENLHNLLFTVPFWGVDGIMVDGLYRAQAVWFGSAVTVPVVIKKVLVDQFIFNPFFVAPFGVSGYAWKNQGFVFRGMSRVFTRKFYREEVLPALIATWGVWIPIVAIIYSLPPLLQIPLFGLALAFWVMLFTYITSLRRRELAAHSVTDPS